MSRQWGMQSTSHRPNEERSTLVWWGGLWGLWGLAGQRRAPRRWCSFLRPIQGKADRYYLGYAALGATMTMQVPPIMSLCYVA
jgi:hypothetical protein